MQGFPHGRDEGKAGMGTALLPGLTSREERQANWWEFYGRPKCKHDRRRKPPQAEGPGSHPRAQLGIGQDSRWSEADLSPQVSPAPLS